MGGVTLSTRKSSGIVGAALEAWRACLECCWMLGWGKWAGQEGVSAGLEAPDFVPSPPLCTNKHLSCSAGHGVPVHQSPLL